MFFWYTFFYDTKIKEQVYFESWEKKELFPEQFLVKFVMVLVQSIALANWFACVPACTSMIVWVSLTRLQGLWPPNLALWWVMLMESHAWSCMTLLSRIHVRSCDKLKIKYFLFCKAYGHQTWQGGGGL